MLKVASLCSLLISIASLTAASAIGERQIAPPPLVQYNIKNLCPSAINLYVAGELTDLLPQGGTVTKQLGPNAGPFYTDANGGRAHGNTRTTRAGFFGENNYYFIGRDQPYVNVGLKIEPLNVTPEGGYCEPIDCLEFNTCWPRYETWPTTFPAPGSAPPAPPLYQCPGANAYEITFCPEGHWPQFRVQTVLRPGSNPGTPGKCIHVSGTDAANGNAVQIYDCNGTNTQFWMINRGSTKLNWAGTPICLDAGLNPTNGTGLKIWQCYEGLAAQQFYYTEDNRIALEGTGLCIDLRDGDLGNGNQLQLWQCTDNNPNQVWIPGGLGTDEWPSVL